MKENEEREHQPEMVELVGSWQFCVELLIFLT